ncbi:Rpn family recombination-promoting nuclease/putative transposase [Vibrio artabrorum]|uniref:Rpn family recombination-promoting nuclease/putative transposase n=1 Tax=Vibrio artabrorum TaxID=446374 RepID=UPI0021C468E4|nr:Rpn family recombination-promoting nuclease/putative transposase [Vibrio artabrorum]
MKKGEKFIVELQKSKQNFFKDRSVFYSSFPIQEQAQKGNWNFELKAIYTIAILDFVFEEDKAEQDKYFYKVKLSDVETHKVFYDKLTYIYLEMPKFTKQLDELESHFERWMYVFKNLDSLESYPESLSEGVFKSLFEEAELAQLPPERQREYENSLKYYRDLNNVIDTAFDDGKAEGHAEGHAEGLAQGKLDIARNLLDILDNETIVLKTGLTESQVDQLRQ